MTNATASSIPPLSPADVRSIAPIGGRIRPVKIVQLPVYHGRPLRLDTLRRAAAPTVTLPLRVVSLNRLAPPEACGHDAA